MENSTLEQHQATEEKKNGEGKEKKIYSTFIESNAASHKQMRSPFVASNSPSPKATPFPPLPQVRSRQAQEDPDLLDAMLRCFNRLLTLSHTHNVYIWPVNTCSSDVCENLESFRICSGLMNNIQVFCDFYAYFDLKILLKYIRSK